MPDTHGQVVAPRYRICLCNGAKTVCSLFAVNYLC